MADPSPVPCPCRDEEKRRWLQDIQSWDRGTAEPSILDLGLGMMHLAVEADIGQSNLVGLIRNKR